MGNLQAMIDGVRVSCQTGLTILEAAALAGVEIPTLCHIPGLTPSGSCRICVVEVEGSSRLLGACHTPIAEGMRVHTRSPRVLAVRKTVIELMFAGHTGPCVKDAVAEECRLHQLAADLEVGPPRFKMNRPRSFPAENVSPYVRRDLSKCILCNRCVRACKEIAGKNIYSMAYRAFSSKVIVDYDVPLDKEACKDCGICIDYCPTSALTLPAGTKRTKAAVDRESPAGAAYLSPHTRERQKLLGRLIDQQKQHGQVSEEAMAALASTLEIPLSEVYGVATFYSFLSVRPQGKNVIRVCKSVPCHMQDAPTILESIEMEIGITPGETTRDGRFSLELTNCIGACDQAPAMQVNDDLHGFLTPEKISKIFRSYK